MSLNIVLLKEEQLVDLVVVEGNFVLEVLKSRVESWVREKPDWNLYYPVTERETQPNEAADKCKSNNHAF